MNSADIARELGVSRAYISMIKSGKRIPSKQLTKKLEKLTGTANFLNGVRVIGG